MNYTNALSIKKKIQKNSGVQPSNRMAWHWSRKPRRSFCASSSSGCRFPSCCISFPVFGNALFLFVCTASVALLHPYIPYGPAKLVLVTIAATAVTYAVIRKLGDVAAPPNTRTLVSEVILFTPYVMFIVLLWMACLVQPRLFQGYIRIFILFTLVALHANIFNVSMSWIMINPGKRVARCGSTELYTLD